MYVPLEVRWWYSSYEFTIIRCLYRVTYLRTREKVLTVIRIGFLTVNLYDAP